MPSPPNRRLLDCGHTALSESSSCTICQDSSYHMPWEDFEHHAGQIAKWISNYHASITEHPVASTSRPGDLRNKLPDRPPLSGTPLEHLPDRLNEVILPGITHWQSPHFYAYFPSNISGPGILGEMLSAGLGVQGMLWKTSPSCTELETHMMDWLVHAMDLPKSFLSTETGGGVIQDSASSAVLSAIIAAREKATQGQSNIDGLTQPLVAYCSTQTHSSIEKAIRIAGIGSANLRTLPVRSDYSLDAGALRTAIREDSAAGLLPFFICATVGTTSSNAMDPVREAGLVAHESGAWYHVDAAMSGTAALCPEFRHLFDGLELADSYCFNPHKWMMTNFDCSCLFVKKKSDLVNSLAINPEYLQTDESKSGTVIDYRDWQIPLGRRFRALKLWLVLQYYGLEGLQYHIRYHVDLAQTLAAWITSERRLKLDVEPALNLLCFSHSRGEVATRKLLQEINASGKAFMTHTVLDGRYVIRWCIGSSRTTIEHIEETWKTVKLLLDGPELN